MVTLSVFLQTCPPRSRERAETVASVEASDIQKDYELLEHPAGQPLCLFYGTVLRTMAQAQTSHVLRLEDDVLVNRHIVHNIKTWPALRHPMFGAGWLFSSEGTHTLAPDLLGDVDGIPIRTIPICYGSLAVVLPVAHVQACVALYESWTAAYGCPISTCKDCKLLKRTRERHAHGQDTLISRTVWERLNKRVMYHVPVLAENRLLRCVRSGNLPNPEKQVHLRAGQYFKAAWKR